MTSRNEKLATQILDRVRIGWTLFRKPKTDSELQELVRMWARALSMKNYPDFVFLDALDLLLSRARAGDPAPMPGDVLAAASEIVQSLERDPVRGPKLAKWREDQLARRDAALNTAKN